MNDIYIDYKGWRWRPPFYCMRCGVEVSAHQWAYSRSCGPCDVGHSHTARLSIFDRRLFAGEHELIQIFADQKDPSFLEADRFLPPSDAEKYPVLYPLKPVFPASVRCVNCSMVRAASQERCNCGFYMATPDFVVARSNA